MEDMSFLPGLSYSAGSVHSTVWAHLGSFCNTFGVSLPGSTHTDMCGSGQL